MHGQAASGCREPEAPGEGSAEARGREAWALGGVHGFWGYMRGMDEEINVYMCVYIYAQVMIADIFRYISGFRV